MEKHQETNLKKLNKKNLNMSQFWNFKKFKANNNQEFKNFLLILGIFLTINRFEFSTFFNECLSPLN